MKTRIIALLLTLCLMLVMVLPATAEAGSVTHKFRPESGALLLRGQGQMPDYSQGTPWADQKADVKEVLLSGVTDISAGALSDCPALTTLYLADAIGAIDPGAFTGTEGIQTIYVTTQARADALRALILYLPIPELQNAEIIVLPEVQLTLRMEEAQNDDTRRRSSASNHHKDDDDSYSGSGRPHIVPRPTTRPQPVEPTENKTYDDQGRLIRSETVNADQTKEITTLEYPDDKAKIPSKTTVDRYAADGKQVSQHLATRGLDESGDINYATRDTTFNYDATGKLTSQDIEYREQGLTEQGTAVPDGDGFTYAGTEKSEMTPNNSTSITRQLDANGNTLKKTRTSTSDTGDTKSTSTTTYGEDGKKLTYDETIESNGGTIYEEHTTYRDGEVNTSRTVARDNDDITEITINKEYNDGGGVKKTVTKMTEKLDNHDGTFEDIGDYESTTEYQYDGKGNPIKEVTTYVEDGGLDGYRHETTTKYNENNDVTESTTMQYFLVMGSGLYDGCEKTVNQYDDSGRLTREETTSYDDIGEQTDKTLKEYSYDDQGTRTSERETVYEGENKDSESVIEYDADGNLTRTERKKYDSTGNLLSERVSENTYDENGLVRTVTETKKDKEGTSVTTTEITYHDNGIPATETSITKTYDVEGHDTGHGYETTVNYDPYGDVLDGDIQGKNAEGETEQTQPVSDEGQPTDDVTEAENLDPSDSSDGTENTEIDTDDSDNDTTPDADTVIPEDEATDDTTDENIDENSEVTSDENTDMTPRRESRRESRRASRRESRRASRSETARASRSRR